jgi:hypothetical protein
LKGGDNMPVIVKETISTNAEGTPSVPVTQVKESVNNIQSVEYLIYFLFGTLETLLVFRLILKVMGASLISGFVKFIYGLTGLFIMPFEGIFRKGFSQGIETTSVLEPSVVVAVVVYAFIAWGIVRLLRVFSGGQQPS